MKEDGERYFRSNGLHMDEVRMMHEEGKKGSLVKSKPINLLVNEKLNKIDCGTVNDRGKIKRIGQGSAVNLITDFESIHPHSVDANEKDNRTKEEHTIFSENDEFKPYEWVSWFLGPLIQRVQVLSPLLLEEKQRQLKQTLRNLGITTMINETAKQLDDAGGLVHFISPHDSDFYTSRLEQAGFFGGNGWFANKGGILGGPGALLSTGSLLTDYTTAYRK
ncbi:uncharacterized protein LOC117171162 [Belonocnema kinseyi]|uniref:uncharacterized protein LOC117171162 n=1 Tax=Belonocnema kinseyi TaxID=2817044 RepID=UPI00143D1AAD|nr:uncharacterized protein LOC117171162 [Belonocnema kinseyi]